MKGICKYELTNAVYAPKVTVYIPQCTVYIPKAKPLTHCESVVYM